MNKGVLINFYMGEPGVSRITETVVDPDAVTGATPPTLQPWESGHPPRADDALGEPQPPTQHPGRYREFNMDVDSTSEGPAPQLTPESIVGWATEGDAMPPEPSPGAMGTPETNAPPAPEIEPAGAPRTRKSTAVKKQTGRTRSRKNS